MTLGNTPMKPTYPNPCHRVYLGWALSVVIKVGMLAVGQNIIISVLLGQFLQGWHKGDIMGYDPPNPFIISVSFWGVSWYSSVLRSRWLSILTDFSGEHVNSIIPKATKTSDFYLFWADLTLLWPWDDFVMTSGVTPMERLTLSHVTMCA